MVQNAIVCYKDKKNNLSNDIFISFFCITIVSGLL